MNRLLGISAAFALISLTIVVGGASPASASPPRAASIAFLSSRTAGHLESDAQASTAIYAPGGPYMAAAYSKSKGILGLVSGDTQSDAEYNALTYCDQLTSNANCLGAQWVLDGWLALAEYNTGSTNVPVIRDWAVSPGTTAQGAKNNAISLCNYFAGANVCSYIGEDQSPSTNKSYTYGSPSIGANDYPTFLATPSQDSVNPDPWNFLNRECTSFVAWRINDNNAVHFSNTMTGPNGKTATFGNASNWMNAATSIGYTYSTMPTARSIAWWASNHVAYVDSVTMSGSKVAGITIEQYNWELPPSYAPGAYSTLYIPVGGTTNGEPYPTGFIHGLEGTQLQTS
jgi:surface antigen